MRIKLIVFFVVFLYLGCIPKKPPPPLEFVPSKDWPLLTKPKDMEAFQTALNNSLNYYHRLPSDYTMFVGDTAYTVGELIEGLKIFQVCLKKPDWQSCLKAHFDLYQATGMNNKKQALFTGYYQPILFGSFSPTERYRYPIYSIPDEWVKIDLRRFGKNLPHLVLKGMVQGHEIVPFYTRSEIDFEHKLKGKGYEILWVDDPVELFFLHIQGSGMVILPDGQRIYVHYAASNGRYYHSIGQSMKSLGLIEDGNGLEIKRYLRSHPKKIKTVFSKNPSYIFFEIRDKGPLGALEEVLVPYYSVATDFNIFPKGAILFITTEIPLVNDRQELLGWRPFSTFAFNQDSGGTIKGSGRVDIFFGTGPLAEAQACYMDRYGKLYLLMKKE